jgi:hypothetical protein
MVKKHLHLLVTTLALCFCKAVWPFAQSATVSGHVYYKNGRPVVDAKVDLHLFEPLNGILPGPVLTDQTGKFTIVYSASGEGTISASKPPEGFPDLGLAIYGREAFSRLKQIKLAPGAVLGNADITLGELYEVVQFEVVDGRTDKPLSSARIYIQLANDDQAMLSSSLDERKGYVLDLPLKDLLVKVSASGFKEWNHTFLASGSGLPGPAGVIKLVKVRLYPPSS